ncbi:hypothetical protein DV532_26355 (plasmid) [Pseudomonas sp. Leaf58]|uniref:hypothetical protein n=1 Tax=Pseudomonas sp. Leaf58 TaxID=1736226 RepID=UPI0006F6FCA9|nr:hypothetical protein [Pseudomonas sp. Leaf58]AYG47809.1 hypothetical protein DV532_26355 [Pseudomonas sp. Leaf58]KQN62624.1 hypothetical protein ASF02_10785 [Pseudomonas sp. Leaf58]
MTDTFEDDPLFVHDPIRPVRPDVIGEVVFMRRWQALQDADDKPEYLDGRNSILRDILAMARHETTQRDASVCASLIRWLGTNNGKAFLDAAEDMVGKLADRKRGFVAAWAVANIRDRQYNLGLNCVDAVLAPDHARLGAAALDTEWQASADDIDTINMMIQWLGSPRGAEFLEGCRKEIATELAAERQRRMSEHNQSRGLEPS